MGEEIVGRYVIERAIAEGGMGIVYAARHFDLDEVVAIKFLKPEFARQQDIINRFAREAKACTRIKSEYIAKVIDVGMSPTRGPFIVMEYLEGEDLSVQLERSGRVAHERAVELVLQACEVLAQAHAIGIIHRDIKPDNLFVVQSQSDVPTVKVLDFGISKTAVTGRIFGNEISVTKTQTLMGTPLYMSPEQLRGQIEVDPRSDVWSIGSVLYELIAGEPAFTGTSVTEVCASVLETVPQPLRQRVPEVPAELDAVVLKCLEKSPLTRYQTIAELAVALQPFGPKRARMCVERAIAAAKAANQVPQSLQSAYSVPPPSNAPTSMKTPAAITLGAISPDVALVPEKKKNVGLMIGIGVVLLCVAGGLGAKALMAPSQPATPPPAAAAAPPPPVTADPMPTPAPAPSPAVEGTAQPSVTASVATHAPVMPAWAPPPGGFRPAAPRPSARTGTASAATPAASPTPPPTQTTSISDAKKSAIDDRK